MQVRLHLYINRQWAAPKSLATGRGVKPTLFGRVKPEAKTQWR